MYRGKLWTMRQYAGFSTAAESNKRYRYLLERGTTGLSGGLRSPHADRDGFRRSASARRGWKRRRGHRLDRRHGALFDAIPLDRVSISMTINAPASILLALLLVVAERRGIAWSKLSGTIQNDILKEYAARGTYIFPAGAVARHRHRHLRVLREGSAALEHDLRSPATTSARRDRRRCRRWPSRSRTDCSTCRRPWSAGWTSTRSRRASRSSSTPTTIFWKRWPSSARRASCGRS